MNGTQYIHAREPVDVNRAEAIPHDAWPEVQRLLESGSLFRYQESSPSPAALLEREFAGYLGLPYALAVNSCSSAIFLALKALGVGPGDKVLLPAFTFSAVPSAVVHAGASPVLVEVGENYRIDIDDFRARLTPDVKAVIVSHMRGHTSDMDALIELCRASGVAMIEDAAHSLGTSWRGQPVGSLGAISCFSFQSYKMMNAGEGGMFVTRDPDLIAKAAIMSGAYEANWKKHEVVGNRVAFWQDKLPLYNLRMNNLSAAVIRPQIADLPRRIAASRANYQIIADRISASSFIDVPEPLPGECRAPDSIQFNLRGVARDEDVRGYLELCSARGVPLQVFGLSGENARVFWNWKFLEIKDDLPKTRKLLMRACDLRIPIWLDEAQLKHIADVLVQSIEQVMSFRSNVG